MDDIVRGSDPPDDERDDGGNDVESRLAVSGDGDRAAMGDVDA